MLPFLLSISSLLFTIDPIYNSAPKENTMFKHDFSDFKHGVNQLLLGLLTAFLLSFTFIGICKFKDFLVWLIMEILSKI